MKPNKTISEFKEFIAKGNVMDMAVGVIIGGAFGKIVTSLVNDILMPIVGILFGGLDFTGLKIQVGTATITYGNFKKTTNDQLNQEEPKKDDTVVLLEEIRYLLKANKEDK